MSGGKGPVCPNCRKRASGNFCQNCGAQLGGRFCNQCGGKVAAGAAFCNECGTKVGAGGEGGGEAGGHRAAAAAVVGGQNLAWWVAGAAMFAVIFFVGVSMVQPAGPTAPAPAPAGAPPGSGPGTTDLASMTPREAADRLFNRVMTAVSRGDSAEAQGFMPMTISAYEQARPLDLDGLFHLSMLNRTALNLEAALANALEILEVAPDHLLGLTAAAEAAIGIGEMETAAEHYRHLLEVFDEENARALEEYVSHSGIVSALKSEAEAFLAGR